MGMVLKSKTIFACSQRCRLRNTDGVREKRSFQKRGLREGPGEKREDVQAGRLFGDN